MATLPYVCPYKFFSKKIDFRMQNEGRNGTYLHCTFSNGMVSIYIKYLVKSNLYLFFVLYFLYKVDQEEILVS